MIRKNVSHTNKSAEAATRPQDILGKVHRVIEFSEEAWLKSYIDMNSELRTKTRMVLRKTFLS